MNRLGKLKGVGHAYLTREIEAAVSGEGLGAVRSWSPLGVGRPGFHYVRYASATGVRKDTPQRYAYGPTASALSTHSIPSIDQER